MALILNVNNDVDFAKTIATNLYQEGYQVITANNGYDALKSAIHERPELVLLEMVLPEMDGIEVCRRLRASRVTASAPILFVIDSHDIDTKIAGFNAGADDCLTKPFDLQELNLRVKALLRRRTAQLGEAQPEIAVGSFCLNCGTFELSINGKKVFLTPVEFQLIRHMLLHAGQVLSPEQLLREVWQYPPGAGSSELVRAHIKNLRNKIEPNPKEPVYIKTVGRFGYALREDNLPQAYPSPPRPLTAAMGIH